MGHHASHIVTLRELGLEFMHHEELVALIPEKYGQYPSIPFSKLLDKLEENTRGRLIFSADKNFPAEAVVKVKPQGLNPAEWDLFKANTKIDKLFVEYVVHG